MKNKYNNPPVGCYVDESSGSADDCNLHTIEFAQSYGFKTDGDIPDPDEDEDYGQILSELADDAVSFLNECETRSYMYWTHKDNSLFLTVDVVRVFKMFKIVVAVALLTISFTALLSSITL